MDLVQSQTQSYSDESLCRLAASGDPLAETELVGRYTRLVRVCARPLFLAGGDSEDLIQEGMIGLFKAVRDYRFDKNASFATFAALCVERQIYKAIEISGRQKHKPLNSYISLSEEDGPLRDTEDASQQNPETIIIGEENAQQMLEDIKQALSPMENQVLDYYLEGADYLQIAEKMKKSPKSIDNALQRIRGKIHGMDF